MSIDKLRIDKKEDNGFVYSYCAPKSGEAPKNVVFILHGDDTNIDRWEKFGRIKQVHESLPDTAVITIQGDVNGYSKKHHDKSVATRGEKVYRWIKYNGAFIIPAIIKDKVVGLGASRRIEKFIDAKLKELNLETKDSAVIGTSMGGVASVNSHINRKNPYGAFVLASSGVITARPLINRVKTIVGKVLKIAAPKSKKQILSEVFNLNAAPREVYLSMMARDNVFDTRGREADKKAKGRSNIIGQITSSVMSALFGREETVKRLEKSGVKVVEKVYDTLPKNNFSRHTTTNTMWFDDIKYVADKLGAKFDENAAEKALKPWAAKNREIDEQASSVMVAFGVSRKEARKRVKAAAAFNADPKNKLKSIISGYTI